MKTFIASGGTDGIGKAIAFALLERGEEVAILGRDLEKGRAFLDTAKQLGGSGRAHFVPVDLDAGHPARRTGQRLDAGRADPAGRVRVRRDSCIPR